MLTSDSRRGFSLLEILVTAVVLAVALTPLLLSMKTSTRAVSGTREYLTAVAFAQRTLEELRRATFREEPPPGGLTPDAVKTVSISVDRMVEAMRLDRPVDATGQGNRLVENNVEYKRVVEVKPSLQNIRDDSLPDVRVFQIDVTWKPPNAGMFQGEQRYQLYSLLGSSHR